VRPRLIASVPGLDDPGPQSIPTLREIRADDRIGSKGGNR